MEGPKGERKEEEGVSFEKKILRNREYNLGPLIIF
jgi:hypothetical protein